MGNLHRGKRTMARNRASFERVGPRESPRLGSAHVHPDESWHDGQIHATRASTFGSAEPFLLVAQYRCRSGDRALAAVVRVSREGRCAGTEEPIDELGRNFPIASLPGSQPGEQGGVRNEVFRFLGRPNLASRMVDSDGGESLAQIDEVEAGGQWERV